MTNRNDGEHRAYKSYEEYLKHFYGDSAGQDTSRLSLEASFGKRLARRVMEVEATEKVQEINNRRTA
jgi:hypothetical protein